MLDWALRATQMNLEVVIEKKKKTKGSKETLKKVDTARGRIRIPFVIDLLFRDCGVFAFA